MSGVDTLDQELADTRTADRERRTRRVPRGMTLSDWAARHARPCYDSSGRYVVPGDLDLLASPEAQPILSRVGAACDTFAADVPRIAHVETVALTVLRARRRIAAEQTP